ncbi:MAG TPA: magnesium transporter [Candidatus Atribacteria bacterium]|nr:magnesium transporter [Candidatus Atribacteria bacterium]
MEKIIKLINEGKYTETRNELIKLNVVDIAQFLSELEEDKSLIVFRLLPKEMAAEVFSYMSSEQQRYIIESITDREIKGIIDELFMDDTVDLLEEMPANVVKKILKNIGEQERKIINQLLMYPDYSAGSLMTIEYVDLRKEMTVGEAIRHIRETAIDKETIDVCYVTDNNRKLEGAVSIRKLILSDEAALVKDLMETNIVSIHTHMDQEEIADLFKKYDLLVMPVVDKENRLVGIITIDDIVDIIEQENTEDFHVMAAMQPSEEEYLKTRVVKLAKNRVLWLLVLMISSTFTGYIIRRFNDVLQSVVVLAAYIPMLMDTSGNAGSQSATMVIRGLALNELKLNDILRVIWKEFRVSLIVGAVLTIVNFLRIYLIEGTDLNISAVVCMSLFITVILAKVIGGSLPIIAKKLRLDPAIMASPFITTIVDAIVLSTYFTLATWLLHI